MTVADLIVQRLRDAGVRTMFGMPGGGSNLDLVEAAGRVGLPFVLTATETGAALAAVAQSEILGAPGVCVTTLGPGVSSVVNGVACASLDRAPLLVFTDTHSESAAAFTHQRVDHAAVLAPVTKRSIRLSADTADHALQDAIACAMTEPRGPVHIDLAPDIASRACDRGPEKAARQGEVAPRFQPGPEMSSSRKPIVLVGLGAASSADALAIRAFCVRHQIPAMVTYKAKGVVPDDHPCFAGVLTNGAVEQPILESADLFIALGLDPVELIPRPWTHAQPAMACGRWRVDEGQIPFAAQIVGDIAPSLDRISECLPASAWDLDALSSDVRAQRRTIAHSARGLTPADVVNVSASAAARARVTVDAGAHMFPATMLWPVREPRGMLISNGLSTMGFALPAAIGAALIDREDPVVALTGDGGLLICAGELLTAARERLRVVTVVFSDASLSLIAVKQQQRRHAAAGVALGDIAWCALAESLGVAAHFANTEEELERAMIAALAHPGPSLVEARVDPGAYAETLRVVRGG